MLTTKEIKLGRQSTDNQDFFSTQEMGNIIAQDITTKGVTILEPSVGSGALIWPLLERVESVAISVNDIEEDYLQYVAQEAKNRNYHIEVSDGLLTISN